MIFLILYLLFYNISEEEAKEIAKRVLKEKYSDICHGWFEKELIPSDSYNGGFGFETENSYCDFYIHVDKFWWYEWGIMPKD